MKEFKNVETQKIENINLGTNQRIRQLENKNQTCFALDAAYSDSEDLAKRTISDKILKEKACEIVRNCNFDGY